MTGHHKFNQLIDNISPERKARIEQKTAQLKQEIALNELQQAFLEKVVILRRGINSPSK
jgi:lipopolysaccharide biosynthesis glycosyltransferase